MMNEGVENVVDKIIAHTAFRDRSRFLDVFHSLFQGIDLRGKSLLDVGCGSGELAIGAVAAGASRAVGLEPELEGSTDGFVKSAESLLSASNFENVSIHNRTVEAYDFRDAPFDVIVMYNVINHLDEQACESLHHCSDAIDKYREKLAMLRSHLAPGGVLIAADCGRRNFFGDLGITNPVVPMIEWNLHQDPKVWCGVLKRAGFSSMRVAWNPLHALRRFGRLAANRPVAYLTNSHFIIWAKN